MATTIAALDAPEVITLGLAGIVTKVTPPPFTRFLWVQFRADGGGLAYTGTDGAAVNPNYLSFTADQLVEIQHAGDRPVYVGGNSNGVEVVITARGF